MLRNRIAIGSSAAAAVVMLLTLTAIGANKPEAWKHDFTEAAKEAKTSGRPLLIHFSASWCLPCRQMEQEVLHQRDVLDVLAEHFIAVEVDCSKPNDLTDQFQVQMLPTDIVIGPDEVVLLKAEGRRNRATYIAQLRDVLTKVNSTRSAPVDRSQDQRLVQNSPAGTARVGETVPERDPAPKPKQFENPNATASKSSTEDKLLIGLDRFSPVSLAKGRQWRKGKTEFALVYQGIVYLMFDNEEYAEFKADPGKFAPRLLGCDPVVLWSTDKAVPGSTQFGAYFDGELFLFSSAENRDTFKGSPTRYSRTQHVLKIDQIDGPRWR